MGLLAELQRRNVIRMAGLYLVGAWLVVQVVDTVFPAFGLPAWALRGVILLLAIGFLPALMFAWIFELTPQGISLESEPGPDGSAAPRTARRMNLSIAVVLLLGLAWFGVARHFDAPPGAGARLGRDPEGKPAWYVPSTTEPGKYIRLAEA